MTIKPVATLATFPQGRDEVRITHDEINGKAKIQIRLWYEEDGEFKPGRQGISLTPENFAAMLKQVKLPAALNGKPVNVKV
jgi:Transcriptional Coactivator p15 (PC4)